MATAAGMSVAVERAIHDVLRETVQRISDQHGIQVKYVHVDWLDLSGLDGSKFMVRGIEATTASRE